MGGPQVWWNNNLFHGRSQGHGAGRCRTFRRADGDAGRGGIRMRRMVALASCAPVRVAAARVRLNAITTQTSQDAFSLAPGGRPAVEDPRSWEDRSPGEGLVVLVASLDWVRCDVSGVKLDDDEGQLEMPPSTRLRL